MSRVWRPGALWPFAVSCRRRDLVAGAAESVVEIEFVEGRGRPTGRSRSVFPPDASTFSRWSANAIGSSRVAPTTQLLRHALPCKDARVSLTLVLLQRNLARALDPCSARFPDRDALSGPERGRQDPRASTMLRLSRQFHVPVSSDQNAVPATTWLGTRAADRLTPRVGICSPCREQSGSSEDARGCPRSSCAGR